MEPRYRAATVKSPEDAKRPEVLARLAVEREWCVNRDIPYTVVDTSGFTAQLLSTLRFLRGWHRLHLDPRKSPVEAFSQKFASGYRRNVPLRQLIATASSKMRVSFPEGDAMFRYCGWRSLIRVDVLSRMRMDSPLVLEAS